VRPPEGQQSLEVPPSHPPLLLCTWTTAPSGSVIVVRPASSPMLKMVVLLLLEPPCPGPWNWLSLLEPQATTAPAPKGAAPLATTIDDRVRRPRLRGRLVGACG